jgi:hypothetical protein
VDQSNAGLVVGLNNPASNLSNLRVEDVVFDQSASAGKEAGTSDNNFISTYEGIMAFGFDGNALIKDVTVLGAAGGVTDKSSKYGIHLQGAQNDQLNTTGGFGNGPTMGTVTLDNVEVAGGFAAHAVAIYNYANINGLAAVTSSSQPVAASLDLTNAKAGWSGGAVLNVDGVLAGYDASKWGVELGNNVALLQGEAYSNPTTPAQIGELGSTITGTADNDVFNSKAGNDNLIGGEGADVAQVFAASVSGVSFGRQSGTNALTVSTGPTLTGTDTLSGVEFVQAYGLTGLPLKTFVMVDVFANNAAAIAAAPNGAMLVKAGPLDVSLVDAASALAKGLSYYGPDVVTINASAADLLAAGPSLGQMRASGVDTFTTTDVISKAE